MPDRPRVAPPSPPLATSPVDPDWPPPPAESVPLTYEIEADRSARNIAAGAVSIVVLGFAAALAVIVVGAAAGVAVRLYEWLS